MFVKSIIAFVIYRFTLNSQVEITKSILTTGEELEGVLSGIDVLRWVTSGEPSRLGKVSV